MPDYPTWDEVAQAAEKVDEVNQGADSAPCTEAERTAPETADPTDPATQPRPAPSIQFVAIPEFADLATDVSQGERRHRWTRRPPTSDAGLPVMQSYQ